MRRGLRLGGAGLLAWVVAVACGAVEREAPAPTSAQGQPRTEPVRTSCSFRPTISATAISAPTGRRQFETPALDRLAREGIRFTQYYAGSTVCAPSRRADDRAAHRPRLDSRQRRDPAAAPRTSRSPMLLRDAGYRTAVIGKWGLGTPGTTGAARQEGLRLRVRLPRSSPRPSAVHRSSVPQRRAGGDRPRARLRQRSVHEGGGGVHRARRPAAVLHLPELHGAARRAARARRTRWRRFAGASRRSRS